MAVLNLPDDLASFLRSGKQLEYDVAACEAGQIQFLPLEQLAIEFFSMDPVGSDDPHRDEHGSYLVKGISLVASCDGYEPKGLLLWFPLDRRYGIWDPEHGTLVVFSTSVSWTDIASDLPRYLNAGWGFEGSEPVSPLSAWKLHPYNAEQLSHSLPDIEEWYDARWIRRGVYRDGVQVRYPQEAEVRIERNFGQVTITARCKPAEAQPDWTARQTRLLSTVEWQSLQPWLGDGFWDQAKLRGSMGEEVTMWSLSGFRESRYHKVFRSLGATDSAADPVAELGRQLMKVAGLGQLLDE